MWPLAYSALGVLLVAISPSEVLTQNAARSQRMATGNELPDTTICGNVLSNRILGGEATQLGEFPWMALLAYRNRYNTSGFRCGGALINTRYVLTAGHCILNASTAELWTLYGVRLGEWDVDTEPDCKVDRKGQKTCAPLHLDVPVEHFVAHNLYNPDSVDQFNDIALVRLKTPVTYTEYIKPICLPTSIEQRNDMFRDVAMDVAGWGVTETMNPSNVKLKIMVNVWNLSECQNKYKLQPVRIKDSQLCAGGREGIDTCRGDSGGPLMTINRINNQEVYFVAGIVSYGPMTCGMRGWPGIYTRVGLYIDWIIENLKP